MTRAIDPTPRPPTAASQIQTSLEGRHVCPFCGAASDMASETCPRCTMENTPAARKATKSRVGPWYVLQTRNPAAPGMNFKTLLTFVKKGRVRPQSIVRGPTTHQLWRFAAQVKGLSREFGVCYSCGGGIESTAELCPQCNRSQAPPANPDILLEAGANGGESEEPLVYKELNVPNGDARLGERAFGAADAMASAETGQPGTMAPRKKAAEAFLSAKDLAAAFKLDFAPTANFEQRDLREDIPVSRPRAQQMIPRPPRPRRRGRKLVLALVLIASGIAAIAYFDPELWQQGVNWVAAMKSHVEQPAEPMFADPEAPPSDPVLASAKQPAEKTEPKTPPPAMIKLPIKPAAPAHVEAAPAPKHLEPPPRLEPSRVEIAVAPPPTPKIAPAPPQPATVTPPPVVEVQPPAVDANVSQQRKDTAEARALYSNAIDCEARGEFAEAVKSYERIKALPKSVWPSDLEVRLKLARQQLE